MNYFIRETINGDPNAGSKARNDISDILQDMGWKVVSLDFIYNERYVDKGQPLFKKIKDNLTLRKEWGNKLSSINNGDTVLVQFPVLRRPALLSIAFSKLKRRGGKVILLIHDLELLRYASRTDVKGLKKARITFEEKSVMKYADWIIVHNSKMKEKMVELGFSSDKLIELEIFDYLIPGFTDKLSNNFIEKSVAIAGNLRPHKTKYLQHLPSDVQFELYGVGYEDQGKENIHYNGSFQPEVLPMQMRASFGLVWDGDSSKTCSGTYGEYLRINNPHKTSLYIASNIPVIIWNEAALAEYIKQNEIGICIASLDELSSALNSITLEHYNQMLENTRAIGKKIRTGTNLKNALKQITNSNEGFDEFVSETKQPQKS